MLTERHRRSQRDKENLAVHIPLNVFPAYCKEKGKIVKPVTHRPKGKENKRGKRNVKPEEFPEFAIRFRNETFQSSKVNESFTSRQAHPLEESFGRQFIEEDARPTRAQATQRQPEEPLKFKNNTIFPHNKKYMRQYSQAIEKIFKGLDVFNRGRISETNINKWIPESALYFLGSVFQKIRQERMTLYYAQFQALCKPLLFQSNQEDVKWFIDEVNGKESHLNVSIQADSGEKQQKNSPVQMRVNYQEQSSKKKEQRVSISEKSSQKNEPIEFSQIINNIKHKEKQLNIRLNSMKEKQQQGIKAQPNNQANQFSFFKDTADFKQISIPASNKRQASASKEEQRSTEQHVPSFSFKLDNPIRPNYQQENFISQKTDRNTEREIPNTARTSRIVRQSIPKSDLNSSKRSSVEPHQAQRIDKLSSRLQEYIRFNNQKIQQNKRFIRQNSLPRK